MTYVIIFNDPVLGSVEESFEGYDCLTDAINAWSDTWGEIMTTRDILEIRNVKD